MTPEQVRAMAGKLEGAIAMWTFFMQAAIGEPDDVGWQPVYNGGVASDADLATTFGAELEQIREWRGALLRHRLIRCQDLGASCFRYWVRVEDLLAFGLALEAPRTGRVQ